MAFFNLRDLVDYFGNKKDTKFFKSTTRALRNSKVNSQALLLGNGPSLMNLNSEMISADSPDIWVVNDFYKVKQAASLKVTHYVLSDRAYFSGLPDRINSKLEPVLNYAEANNATLVLPHWAKNLNFSQISNLEIFYFDDRELSAWSSNTSPVKPRGYIGLTLYKALGFALYLGYRKVFILGMDNSEFKNYSSDEANRILLLGNHSYKDESTPTDLSDHYLDGMASVFSSVSHVFGDLSKFKGPIVNLDGQSLTTRFPKEPTHHWVS
jgi:hypothetical protein